MIERITTRRISNLSIRNPLTVRPPVSSPEITPELFLKDNGISGEDFLLLETDDVLLLE